MYKTIQLLREFSIPLITGVIAALAWANLSPEGYQAFVHYKIFGDIDLHFIANDIIMVFFFGIAAVEITQSVLPGGDLNPIKKAINPLFATLGGVIGPIVVFFVLNSIIGDPAYTNGWGIPTATDIALAWLIARFIFGAKHPAVSFLLLLAIVDDAIGLGIIAIFYPDPTHPVQPIWLLLTVIGMGVAFILRKVKVNNYWPYMIIGGLFSWFGLYKASIHPALALVFIIPFLPHAPRERDHLFEEDVDDHTPLAQFEHEWKAFVDFGLFVFGLTNAGVEFSGIGTITWIIFLSLLLGKSLGISSFALLGEKFGFPLPQGMSHKDVFLVGVIAGLGLTVALFVAGAAFTDPTIQGAAKMGAVFSAFIALIAFVLARFFKVNKEPNVTLNKRNIRLKMF
ncbi:Na+/H+ antiporter NhaA [Tepidibacillus infernus]|uniref:Na(+)/H(+) antiporter NhaA n=1 Tax=Tepidibacillus decaturensis TaxID=1413211 RepID=A0A135L1K5_9BACI|nr:Na+/H+ antiporter NhaA [Tepidibacillus decaturensis]KXG42904.1 sodium:proton antiporter [Tepidibacillus decaturensis]